MAAANCHPAQFEELLRFIFYDRHTKLGNRSKYARAYSSILHIAATLGVLEGAQRVLLALSEGDAGPLWNKALHDKCANIFSRLAFGFRLSRTSEDLRKNLEAASNQISDGLSSLVIAPPVMNYWYSQCWAHLALAQEFKDYLGTLNCGFPMFLDTTLELLYNRHSSDKHSSSNKRFRRGGPRGNIPLFYGEKVSVSDRVVARPCLVSWSTHNDGSKVVPDAPGTLRLAPRKIVEQPINIGEAPQGVPPRRRERLPCLVAFYEEEMRVRVDDSGGVPKNISIASDSPTGSLLVRCAYGFCPFEQPCRWKTDESMGVVDPISYLVQGQLNTKAIEAHREAWMRRLGTAECSEVLDIMGGKKLEGVDPRVKMKLLKPSWDRVMSSFR